MLGTSGMSRDDYKEDPDTLLKVLKFQEERINGQQPTGIMVEQPKVQSSEQSYLPDLSPKIIESDNNKDLSRISSVPEIGKVKDSVLIPGSKQLDLRRYSTKPLPAPPSVSPRPTSQFNAPPVTKPLPPPPPSKPKMESTKDKIPNSGISLSKSTVAPQKPPTPRKPETPQKPPTPRKPSPVPTGNVPQINLLDKKQQSTSKEISKPPMPPSKPSLPPKPNSPKVSPHMKPSSPKPYASTLPSAPPSTLPPTPPSSAPSSVPPSSIPAQPPSNSLSANQAQAAEPASGPDKVPAGCPSDIFHAMSTFLIVSIHFLILYVFFFN